MWFFISIVVLLTCSSLVKSNFISQLNEVKRKIALVEGKRRALQSSFERENKENRTVFLKVRCSPKYLGIDTADIEGRVY